MVYYQSFLLEMVVFCFLILAPSLCMAHEQLFKVLQAFSSLAILLLALWTGGRMTSASPVTHTAPVSS